MIVSKRRFRKVHGRRALGDMYRTLHEIAKNQPARTAVEVGICRGWSTIPLLDAMRVTGGHLWSLDIRDCRRARQKVADAGMTGQWTYLQESSWEWQGCPDNLDFIFIDGDHEHVAKDWEHFEPKVRQGGLILLHDYFGGCYKVCGVCPQCLGPKTLVDTVIRPQWQRWECATLPYGHGLTIVRKR